MRPRFGPFLMFVSVVAIAAGLLIAGSERSQPELPFLGELPRFALTDQRAQPFSNRNLTGRAAVVNVVFTRCPTVCPVVTMKLKQLEKATRDLGDQIAFVSFSVNPEYDSPAVLASFAKKFGADSPRWYFLTGPAEGLTERVEQGFKLALDNRGLDAAGVPDIIHGTHFVLVDQRGHMRGYYDSDDAERLAELERDLRRLVAQ